MQGGDSDEVSNVLDFIIVPISLLHLVFYVKLIQSLFCLQSVSINTLKCEKIPAYFIYFIFPVNKIVVYHLLQFYCSK